MLTPISDERRAGKFILGSQRRLEKRLSTAKRNFSPAAYPFHLLGSSLARWQEEFSPSTTRGRENLFWRPALKAPIFPCLHFTTKPRSFSALLTRFQCESNKPMTLSFIDMLYKIGPSPQNNQPINSKPKQCRLIRTIMR